MSGALNKPHAEPLRCFLRLGMYWGSTTLSNDAKKKKKLNKFYLSGLFSRIFSVMLKRQKILNWFSMPTRLIGLHFISAGGERPWVIGERNVGPFADTPMYEPSFSHDLTTYFGLASFEDLDIVR